MPKDIDTSFLDDLDPSDGGMFKSDTVNPKSRKPMQRLATNTRDLLRSTAKVGSKTIGKHILRSMPDTSTLFDDLDSAAAIGKETVGDINKQALEVSRTLRRATSMVLPKVKGYLPKKLYDKLEAASKIEEQTGYKRESDYDAHATEVQGLISDMFDKQMALTASDIKQRNTESLVERATESIRHKNTIGVLSSINDHLMFQNRFMSGVQQAWMRKTLELKYMHLYTAKETLGVLKTATAMLDVKLDAVVKNTSLPDIVKGSRISEMAKYSIRGKVAEKFSGSFTKMASKLAKNFKEGPLELLNTVAQMSEMGMDAMKMQAELAEDMPELKTSKGTKIGNILGWGLGKVMGQGSLEKVRPYTTKLEMESSQALAHLRTGTRNLHDKLTSSDNIVLQLLGSLLPVTQPNLNVGNDLLYKGGDATIYDNATRQSIVEIIPKWLSVIAKNTRDMFVGSETELQTYDVISRNIVGVGAAREAIERRMFGSRENRSEGIIRSVGAIKGTIERNKNVESGRFEDLKVDITKMVDNAVAHGILISGETIRAFKDADTEKDIDGQTINLLLKGVSNKLGLIRLMNAILYDNNGILDKDSLALINRGITMEQGNSNFSDSFANFLETFGARSLYPEIKGNTVAAEDRSRMRLDIDAGRFKTGVDSAAGYYRGEREMLDKYENDVRTGKLANMASPKVREKASKIHAKNIPFISTIAGFMVDGERIEINEEMAREFANRKDHNQENGFDRGKKKFAEAASQMTDRIDETLHIKDRLKTTKEMLAGYWSKVPVSKLKDKEFLRGHVAYLSGHLSNEFVRYKNSLGKATPSKADVQAYLESIGIKVMLKANKQADDIIAILTEQLHKVTGQGLSNDDTAQVAAEVIAATLEDAVIVEPQPVDTKPVADAHVAKVKAKLKTVYDQARSKVKQTTSDVQQSETFQSAKAKVTATAARASQFTSKVSDSIPDAVATAAIVPHLGKIDSSINALPKGIADVLQGGAGESTSLLDELKSYHTTFKDYMSMQEDGNMFLAESVLFIGDQISGSNNAGTESTPKSKSKLFGALKLGGRMSGRAASRLGKFYKFAFGKLADVTKVSVPAIAKAAGSVLSALIGGGVDLAKVLTPAYLKMAGGVYKGLFKTTGKAFDAIGSMFSRKQKKKGFVDIYLKDQVELGKPLLSAKDQKQRAIRSDGKMLKSSYDIDVPIIHLYSKDILISEEDIKHGLVDANNEPLTSASTSSKFSFAGNGLLSKGIGALITGGSKFYGTMLKGMAYGTKAVFDRAIHGKAGKYVEVTSRLDRIYDLLENRLAKKVKFDSDGDGDVDNSYDDYMQKRKEQQEKGTFSRIKQALGGKRPAADKDGNRIDDDNDNGGGNGLLTALLGISGVGSALKYGKRTIRGIKNLKNAAWLSKLGGSKAMLAARGLLGTAGSTLTGGLGLSGLSMAPAASIASLGGGALLGSGAMIAGAGYGGYKLGQYIDKKYQISDKVGEKYANWRNKKSTAAVNAQDAQLADTIRAKLSAAGATPEETAGIERLISEGKVTTASKQARELMAAKAKHGGFNSVSTTTAEQKASPGNTPNTTVDRREEMALKGLANAKKNGNSRTIEHWEKELAIIRKNKAYAADGSLDILRDANAHRNSGNKASADVKTPTIKSKEQEAAMVKQAAEKRSEQTSSKNDSDIIKEGIAAMSSDIIKALMSVVSGIENVATNTAALSDINSNLDKNLKDATKPTVINNNVHNGSTIDPAITPVMPMAKRRAY
jgi:hypothetical protein